MSRPEFIFVPSIMGTGTVFVLRFFEASEVVGQKQDKLHLMKNGFRAPQVIVAKELVPSSSKRYCVTRESYKEYHGSM